MKPPRLQYLLVILQALVIGQSAFGMTRLWPWITEVEIDSRDLSLREIVGKVMDIVDKYAQIVQGLFLSLFERAQHDGCLSPRRR